jgi:putative DNA primase/helicase
MTFVPTTVLNQFIAAMQRRGLVPPPNIVGDGVLRRCNVKSKGGRGDGAFLLHADGVIPAGGFQNWQDSRGWENWQFDPGRELTPGEIQEVRRKSEATATAVREAKARDQANAAAKAKRIWAASVDAPVDMRRLGLGRTPTSAASSRPSALEALNRGGK